MKSLPFYSAFNNLCGLGDFIDHRHLFLLEFWIYFILIYKTFICICVVGTL